MPGGVQYLSGSNLGFSSPLSFTPCYAYIHFYDTWCPLCRLALHFLYIGDLITCQSIKQFVYKKLYFERGFVRLSAYTTLWSLIAILSSWYTGNLQVLPAGDGYPCLKTRRVRVSTFEKVTGTRYPFLLPVLCLRPARNSRTWLKQLKLVYSYY